MYSSFTCQLLGTERSHFNSGIWNTVHFNVFHGKGRWEREDRVGFEKGPLGPRMGSREQAAVSANTSCSNTLRGPQGQGKHVTDQSCITYIQFTCHIYIQFRNLKVVVSMMWIIQGNRSMALECIVFWQYVFLPNFILGSKHILVNMVKCVGQ